MNLSSLRGLLTTLLLFFAVGAHAEQTQNPKTCPILKELSFTTDFANLMTNHKADYKDGGVPYTKPDWTKAGKNNPIVHERNKKIALKVTYTCDSTNAGTYKLEGKSPKGETLHFGPKDVTFVVGDNVVALEAAQALPNSIDDNAGDKIEWTLSGHCKETTGPHQIYVTAGMPFGSLPTEWRIAYVTKLCDGFTTGVQCITKIHESGGKYSLDAKPDMPWAIAAGAQGQCIHLVQYYIFAMAMLGWQPPGDIIFIYPNLGMTAFASANPAANVIKPGAGDRILGFRDGNGGLNRWEAALLYGGKYYAGGAGIYDSAQACMDDICDASMWTNPSEVAEDWP